MSTARPSVPEARRPSRGRAICLTLAVSAVVLLPGCRDRSTPAASPSDGRATASRPDSASGPGADDWFVDRAGTSGSTSPTSTACPASSTIRRSWRRRRPARLRQRRRPRRLSRAGADARQGKPLHATHRSARRVRCSGPAVPQRSARERDGTRTLHFTDVTDAERHRRRDGYGMGVAAGDFDNDGCVDLYLTDFGAESAVPQQRRRHVHRRLEGRAGTDRDGWSVSAAFVDYDRDGWLDLFVGNYLQLQPRRQTSHCLSLTGRRDYCPPNSLPRRSRAASITTTATARSPT